MPKLTDARIAEVTCDVERYAYRTPMKFGGRVVTEVTLLKVTLTLECRDGRRGTGFGSMPLGNAWAWPSTTLDGGQTLAAMQSFADRTVAQAQALDVTGHPLELGHELSRSHAELAAAVAAEHQMPESMPRLAQLVAASPLDAALHDAYGHALGRNSYQLLSREFVNSDLARYLGPEFAGEYLDRYVRSTPNPRMPLYHLVGALDPLTDADVAQPVGDELPETLGQWIVADGLTHLKIKLAGDDLEWDAARVLAVERVAAAVAQATSQQVVAYSLDFNERCREAQYVIELLDRVRRASPAAFDRIQYIEQPTHRDLKAHPHNRMHRAAQIKPVVIDESLVDLESLLLAREQGYSGVALKACKGHGEALLMGAAAQKFGLYLCVQDLTCPGASFLHSASLAARIPTVAAIEGNSRQYCPAGNREWAKLLPTAFAVRQGTIDTSVLDGPGLGYSARMPRG